MSFAKSLLFTTLATSAIYQFALANDKNEFNAVATCGTASITSGDTCSNVKVAFAFENCPIQFEPVEVTKVTCEGQNVIARTTRADHRFEAKFKKADDGWGSISWQPVGKIKVWAKASAPVERAVSQQKETAAASPAAAALSALQLSAFLDVRHTTFKTEDTAAKEDESSGFLFEDAAIYLNYTDGPLTVLVDLPFQRNADNTADSADLGFAKTKAQAYGKYNISEGLNFVFGQFDTFFGVEVNDSKDRVFGYTGLVYQQTIPVVHSGAYLDYAVSNFTFKLMAANPADREALGSNRVDASHEYGAAAGFNNGQFRGQVGYLTRKVENLNNESAQRALTDVLLGATFGNFNLDLEYSIVDDPRKNLLDATATNEEDAGSAFMALATYQATDKTKLGLRYELLTDSPGAADYQDADTYSANVQYQLHRNLFTRVEGMQVDVKEGTAFDEHRFSVSGLLVF